MRALRLVAALLVLLGLAGCGSAGDTVMPSVVGKQLDVAKSDIKRAGFSGEVEVLGGGLLGILDESNWLVCEQLPAAGEVVADAPRLRVDRSCESQANETSAPTSSASVDEASATPTDEQPASADANAAILTVKNNKDLAALRKLGDYCDDKIAAFAETYRGRTIRFDGSIGAMSPHGDYRTRYDILLGFGDDGTSTRGPSFQFRDVNTTSDLGFEGAVPDTIRVGDNLRVTANVGEFVDEQCLLLLEPVSTELR
ncbi:MAG: DUF4839 domain-containing protein [Propionicimonas sp.]|uniref:DUF4839 domain-containing protein n=1 Tax=Propionicimonas sp. TaxID=1955623 RepID=UPI003D0DA667